MAVRILNPVHSAARRGLTVIEVTMALLVLSFAVGGLLQILSLAASQRRATEIRRLAVEEVANQAEAIALVPWEELTAEKLAARRPAAGLIAAAPSATLNISTSDEAVPPAAKRIHISAAWTTPAGEPAQSVQLTLWRHQP
jgi:hypothetical protein